jgi:hypothetical protein
MRPGQPHNHRGAPGRYVFAYDAGTLAELDAVAHPRPVKEQQ